MGMIKLLAAPIRSIVRFPLFQLAVVVAVILLLQAADDKSATRPDFQWPGQTRRVYRGIVFGGIQREILHKIMAHIRLLDCVCLPRLFADSVPSAVSNQ